MEQSNISNIVSTLELINQMITREEEFLMALKSSEEFSNHPEWARAMSESATWLMYYRKRRDEYTKYVKENS